MNKLIFLNEVSIEESPKVRAALNEEVAAEYGNLYKAKVNLPVPVLYQAKGDKFLRIGDGLHRITGAKAVGNKTLLCEVREGGFEEALAHALQSNTSHGLRRSQADKRRCIEAALDQWPKLSDTELAKRCAVDHKTVSGYRKSMEGEGKLEPSVLRETKTGVVRTATRAAKKAADEAVAALGNSLKEQTNGLLKDNEGFPIPEELQAFWKRIPEVQNLIDTVRSVKGEAELAQKDDDLMWAEVTLDTVIAGFNELITKLKVLIPHAVCTSCQGKLKTKCGLCHGRGLISKFRWDTVPAETKALRAKAIKEAK